MEWFNILRKISDDEMYQELGLEPPNKRDEARRIAQQTLQEDKKAEEQRIANQKQKNIEAGKALPPAPTLPEPYSNVPEMVNLPESEEMKTNKVNAMNRIMEQTGSNYKVERATPENLKRNWQKQLQRKQQEKEKLELQRRANKEKKRENRAAKKLQRTRSNELKDDKKSGLTDAGRRFLDNKQRVADAKPKNVTTVGVAPKS